MEGEGDSMVPRSCLKLTGEKRSSGEPREKQEAARKRIKMQNLESVLRSEETGIHHSGVEEAGDLFGLGKQTSQITNVPVTLDPDAFQAQRSRAVLPVEVIRAPKPLDLNSEVCTVKDSRSNGVPESPDNKVSLLKKQNKEHDKKCITFGSTGLDLNVEDVSSVNQDSFCNQNCSDQLRSRDVSECGSTAGTVQEKDALRVWKEMKQNGFLSTSHAGFSIQNGSMSSSYGGIPIPKQRGRKSKSDVLKKNMELAKREQVDRFTKIAAPSGLLNGLNPGIINHVRNRKQVHSIIEALVRCEKLEKGSVENKQASLPKIGTKETNHIIDLGRQQLGLYYGNESSAGLYGSRQAVGDTISRIEQDSRMEDRMYGRNSGSPSALLLEDDSLALKLSSSIKATEGSSNSCNAKSANVSSVSYLSVRTATVASQWLELLHQDIKGRLSALRRSKKRVKAVVSTELPFLISKEFSPNQENNSFVMKSSFEVVSTNPTAAAHQGKWFALFDQMDKALSEEERQLESSLNEVKELQLHCDHGLQHFSWNIGLQPPGRMENISRSEKEDSSVSELAVRAAAASIYSTCSFLMSQGNVSCF